MALRDSIYQNDIRYVVSTRNIAYAKRLLESEEFSLEEILLYTAIQGMDNGTLDMVYHDISNLIPENSCVSAFQKAMECKQKSGGEVQKYFGEIQILTKKN